MAKPPKFIQDVQFVAKVFMQNCEEPFTLYLETALPPLGNAVLTLLSFGFDDVVRGFARPKGLRSGRHGRDGKKKRPPGGGIPDVGDSVGKSIPGQQAFSKRQVSDGVKNLWIIDGALQRVLFWWLVADVTSTFFYEWASGINEVRANEGCGPARLLKEGTGGGVAAITPWNAIGSPVVKYAKGYETSPFGATLLRGKGNVVGTATLLNVSTFEGKLTARLRIQGQREADWPVSGGTTIAPGASGSVVASGLLERGQTAVLEVHATAGFYAVTHASMFGTG